jgi:hypothetical protein
MNKEILKIIWLSIRDALVGWLELEHAVVSVLFKARVLDNFSYCQIAARDR